MALKGLDIFKLTPKTNCKECGNPTCMAFSMKVAQGAIPIEKCPYLTEDVLAQVSDATAPPMKTIKVGTGENEHNLGGETVLQRHEKTFVNKNIYAVTVSNAEGAKNEEVFASVEAIDYSRISERMYIEAVFAKYDEKGSKELYLELVKKAADTKRLVIIDCKDTGVAKAALELIKDTKPVLNGANAENYAEMSALAKEYDVVLGVAGNGIEELHDTIEKIEADGNKNLLIDLGTKSIKDAFANAVLIRRGAILGQDRSFGYPSIADVGGLAKGNRVLETALASLFTMKYGSIVVMENMSYSQALPLYGLRQNIFTDPQKPMKVEPGIYRLNGADENSVCMTTVDFALTYFIVSGEIERSGVPCNLLISDAGGYSVLTAWAAGKLSASSLAKFFEENDIEGQIKNRTLVIPGKVAVLKGEIQEKLPGWDIVVGSNEAVQIVKFLQDYK
ncbi:acetyl-CoA decarbonylase/synthase complex subunit gamma [Parasporobacterium paucivorans]|uniref:CO-methylating acetyl-CoA synthase corrinoid iron-sulfur protein large subunit n=1 Tax=Parasporobacterium paucivorans DSM 15970 TaxID=1122934 RepID=A0A1M6A948_9FIRM|nr:acetyl-CoA decarbonylase/synthase complex subunit gamma [Parasporobacterium paucivorans]SHI32998.1 CO-methylating acetyl-CoA synthase corrinoid iron-sulfur protein large subunit precursor [Parasporobacterium paucivorans DSM 15970]